MLVLTVLSDIHTEPFPGFSCTGLPEIHNLQLQESRLQRTLLKALEDLREAQTARRALEQARLAEVVDARALCRNTGEAFDPAALGFDFTEAEIDREEKRRQSVINLRKRPANPDWRAFSPQS